MSHDKLSKLYRAHYKVNPSYDTIHYRTYLMTEQKPSTKVLQIITLSPFQKNTFKVIKYKEIMTNDDNLESNLPTSSLLKKMSGLYAGTR